MTFDLSSDQEYDSDEADVTPVWNSFISSIEMTATYPTVGEPRDAILGWQLEYMRASRE